MTVRVEPGGDPDKARDADEVIRELQRKHGEALHRWICGKKICAQDASVIIQDSLLAVRERLKDEKKPPIRNELAYFKTALNSQVTQFFRDQKKKKEDPHDMEAGEFSQRQAEPAPAAGPVESWPLERQMMYRAANQAKQELSEHLREVYELAIEGLEPVDIAKMLEKPSTTVRAHLSNARKQVNDRAHELFASLMDQHQKPRENGEGGDHE